MTEVPIIQNIYMIGTSVMKELIFYLYQRKIFILTCIDYFGSMFHELLYLFIKFESSNKSIIYLSITKTEYLLQLYMIREILLDGKFYKKKCFSISKIASYLVGYPILLHKNEVFHQGVSQSMWQNPDETVDLVRFIFVVLWILHLYMPMN